MRHRPPTGFFHHSRGSKVDTQAIRAWSPDLSSFNRLKPATGIFFCCTLNVVNITAISLVFSFSPVVRSTLPLICVAATLRNDDLLKKGIAQRCVPRLSAVMVAKAIEIINGTKICLLTKKIDDESIFSESYVNSTDSKHVPVTPDRIKDYIGAVNGTCPVSGKPTRTKVAKLVRASTGLHQVVIEVCEKNSALFSSILYQLASSLTPTRPPPLRRVQVKVRKATGWAMKFFIGCVATVLRSTVLEAFVRASSSSRRSGKTWIWSSSCES